MYSLLVWRTKGVGDYILRMHSVKLLGANWIAFFLPSAKIKLNYLGNTMLKEAKISAYGPLSHVVNTGDGLQQPAWF